MEERPAQPAAHEPDAEEEGTAGTGGAGGAEAYRGDPDAGPSVTEEEVQRGLERDQAEG